MTDGGPESSHAVQVTTWISDYAVKLCVAELQLAETETLECLWKRVSECVSAGANDANYSKTSRDAADKPLSSLAAEVASARCCVATCRTQLPSCVSCSLKRLDTDDAHTSTHSTCSVGLLMLRTYDSYEVFQTKRLQQTNRNQTRDFLTNLVRGALIYIYITLFHHKLVDNKREKQKKEKPLTKQRQK